MARGRAIWFGQRGSVSAEFALIAPMVVMILGGFLFLGVQSAASASRDLQLRSALLQLARGMPEEQVLEQLRGLATGPVTVERAEASICLRTQAAQTPSGALGWLAVVGNAGRSLRVCGSALP